MRKVTIEDVAKAAGVSRALVSIAYRGAPGVSEATAQRIFAVGSKLGYVPNLNAARLASKGNKIIGVFLQDLHNEVFADIFDGIRSVINEDQIQVVIAVGSARPGHDVSALETLIASRVDVVLALGLTMDDVSLKSFTNRIKIISVTRRIEDGLSVLANDYLGAQLATRHLLELGHRRVAFLANPQTDGYRERLRGYEETMAEVGLESFVKESTYLRLEAEFDAGELIDSYQPTAIFAHNDQAALGVLDALVARNLKPGIDVSVVGYDNTSLSQTPILALSTIDPHSFQLGETSANLALEILEENEASKTVIELVPELIVRSSSGQPS